MKDNTPKMIAHQILQDERISRVTLDNLVYFIEKRGFEIIDFSRIEDNNEATRIMMERFQLTEVSRQNSAFLYVQGDLHYVFLDESMSANDKLYALAHELGHICLEHTRAGSFVHGTFEQEHEANEFAHYLLHPSVRISVIAWATEHKIWTAAIVLAVVLLIAAIPVTMYVQSKIYHDYYFVTDSGEHYHMEDCFYIQGKDVHRMTKEEFESGNYTPCKICIH